MATFQMFRLEPVEDEVVVKEGDEWAGLQDARERRKRQNRLNQRAARRRHRLAEVAAYEKTTQLALDTRQGSSRSNPAMRGCSDAHAGPTVPPSHPAASSAVYFPLSRDNQLLALISFNISRAVLTNYFIIASIPTPESGFCEGRRVFRLPTAEEAASWTGWNIDQCTSSFTLPPSLMPTEIQKRVPHHPWIDLFPSAQLRDNLIMGFENGRIDEDELMMDLVGEVMEHLCIGTGDSSYDTVPQPDDGGGSSHDGHGAGVSTPAPSSHQGSLPAPPTGEPGIVSWSDPWDINGWELTEGFARKWGFLLRKCPDVVDAANRWRDLRGEDALVVEI